MPPSVLDHRVIPPTPSPLSIAFAHPPELSVLGFSSTQTVIESGIVLALGSDSKRVSTSQQKLIGPSVVLHSYPVDISRIRTLSSSLKEISRLVMLFTIHGHAIRTFNASTFLLIPVEQFKSLLYLHWSHDREFFTW
jgi:hypothetical protein